MDKWHISISLVNEAIEVGRELNKASFRIHKCLAVLLMPHKKYQMELNPVFTRGKSSLHAKIRMSSITVIIVFA